MGYKIVSILGLISSLLTVSNSAIIVKLITLVIAIVAPSIRPRL